jgi:5-methylthioadenosine/S-adenosylhomocysteine deaminase
VSTSLVRGKYVISHVLDRDRAHVIENGAVFQRDGVIVDVGSFGRLDSTYTADRIIGSPDYVVMPGLTDAHHHVGLSPFQLGVSDDALEPWLARCRGTRAVDPYLDTLYSAFELIASGVTTVVHLQGRLPRPLARAEELARRVLAAYDDIGMRASWAVMLRDQNQFVYEADEVFVARLPDELRADAQAALDSALALDENLGLFETLHTSYRNHDRLQVQLAPGTMRSLSDEALMTIKACARKYTVPMHIHLLETVYQTEHARRRAGKTAPAHLRDLGFLGPDVTLGHAVWLTEADVDIVAEAGARVCHNPSSNLRLRSGIAPVIAYERAGIPVALGIDESGLNDDRDMLQEMRLALRLHRPPGMDDADVLTPTQVFRMASQHGASTTPFAGRIGALETGKVADMVLVRWDQVAYPYLDPDTSPVDAVVMRGKAPVDTVLIAGEPVLEHGRFTRVDRTAALNELAHSLRVPLTPDEQRRRAFAAPLVPHVKQYCTEFLDMSGATGGPVLEPYYQTSSRYEPVRR